MARFLLQKKRGTEVGKTKRGKGTKVMALSDGHGTPLGCFDGNGINAWVKLIEPLIKRVRIPRRGRGRPKKRVKRLIDDKAADSDPLRKRLKTKRIELIAPHRRGRRQPSM